VKLNRYQECSVAFIVTINQLSISYKFSVSRVLGFTNMKTSPQILRFIHQSQCNSVWFFVFCSITTYIIDEGFVATVLVFFADVN